MSKLSEAYEKLEDYAFDELHLTPRDLVKIALQNMTDEEISDVIDAINRGDLG